MPITRSIQDFNQYVDFTDAVEEIPNQYGLINGMGLFEFEGVTTDAVLFDRMEHSIKLPAPVARGKRAPVTNSDPTVKTFALALGMYKDTDQVTGQDVFKARRPGSMDADTIGRVVAQKLRIGLERFNQLEEYQKVQAIKGLVVDGAGNTITSMFTEFGISQQSVDFKLGDATTDIDAKIRELKTKVTKNAKTGARTGEIIVPCDPVFFDRLVGHDKIRDAYKHYQNTTIQVLRDDEAMYEAYGIVNRFRHKGVLFMSYDAEFTLSTGSTVPAFAENTGYTIVRGISGAYKQYAGPHDKLPSGDGATESGRKLYAFQYRDPKDEAIEIDYQASPLIVLRRPQLSVAVTSSD